MPKSGTSVRSRIDVELDEPKQYKVTIFNDDFTTMDFVVKVLCEVFDKDEIEAERLMIAVHKGGKAVIGYYTLDIAATKVDIATEMARAEGFPLKITYSPAEDIPV